MRGEHLTSRPGRFYFEEKTPAPTDMTGGTHSLDRRFEEEKKMYQCSYKYDDV